MPLRSFKDPGLTTLQDPHENQSPAEVSGWAGHDEGARRILEEVEEQPLTDVSHSNTRDLGQKQERGAHGFFTVPAWGIHTQKHSTRSFSSTQVNLTAAILNYALHVA